MRSALIARCRNKPSFWEAQKFYRLHIPPFTENPHLKLNIIIRYKRRKNENELIQ